MEMWKRNKYYVLVLFVFLLILVVVNLNWEKKPNSSFEQVVPYFLLSDFATDSLQTGDVILRNGTGIYSRINRFIFSKEKQYSHCGIISVENDTVFVYHALGGRESVTNQLRKDELMHYCNKKATKEVGFYRYALSDEDREELSVLIEGLYNRHTDFDSFFDLETDENLYHTEFVYYVLESVTEQKELIKVSTFFGRKYISIDNLYKNDNAIPLASFDFR